MASVGGNNGEDPMQQLNDEVVEVPAAGGNGAAPRLQWTAAMSGFILRHFSDLIAEGVRTDKGFKDCHLNQVAHMLSDFTGQQVSASQATTICASGVPDGSRSTG